MIRCRFLLHLRQLYFATYYFHIDSYVAFMITLFRATYAITLRLFDASIVFFRMLHAPAFDIDSFQFSC